MSARLPRNAAVLFGLAAVYFVAGKLGLRLASVNASATAVWAPTGIALAAFLILGYRVWPAVLVSAFLVNVTTAGSVVISISIGAGNTLEGIVGAYLVNRFAGGRNALQRAPDVFSALCRVAHALSVSSRSMDTAARFGGDEFALVMPETREAAARQVARRIGDDLAMDTEQPAVSLSVGGPQRLPGHLRGSLPHASQAVASLIGLSERAASRWRVARLRGRRQEACRA